LKTHIRFTQILICLVCLNAHAEKGIDCANRLADAGLTTDKKCALEDYGKADSELNKIYKLALAEINKQAESMRGAQSGNWGKNFRNAFIRSQRNWVKFKEIYCNDVMEYLNWGGSGTSLSQYDCMVRLTRERTKQIKEDFYIK